VQVIPAAFNVGLEAVFCETQLCAKRRWVLLLLADDFLFRQSRDDAVAEMAHCDAVLRQIHAPARHLRHEARV
jgi:hypothetical protein